MFWPPHFENRVTGPVYWAVVTPVKLISFLSHFHNEETPWHEVKATKTVFTELLWHLYSWGHISFPQRESIIRGVVYYRLWLREKTFIFGIFCCFCQSSQRGRLLVAILIFEYFGKEMLQSSTIETTPLAQLMNIANKILCSVVKLFL